MRAGGENQMLELEVGVTRRASNLERLRTGERRATLNELDLAQPGDTADAGGQLIDHALLVGAELPDVDAGLAERHAPVAGVPGFVHDLGHVQQRLRRNAPPVQTDTAGILLFVDERDLHAEIGCVESGGIATRPRTEYHELCRFCHQSSTPNFQPPTSNHSRLTTPKRSRGSPFGNWALGMVGAWELAVGSSRMRIIRPVKGGKVARSLPRPSAGSASRRRRRSRGDRTRARAEGAARARTCRLSTPARSRRARRPESRPRAS